MDQRQDALQQWLNAWYPNAVLTPIVGDASFRRYFRMIHNAQPYIVMDAPPELEPCQSFVDIAEAYQSLGLRTPRLFQKNIPAGWLVIEDFGDHLFHRILSPNTVDTLYGAAIQKLPRIQQVTTIQAKPLASFDATMIKKELDNFTHWFLEQYLSITLTPAQHALLEKTFALLIQNAEEQPQVGIHRDYHSRNLMALPDQEVGILDFQDAMIGPLTYDLVSLIRDCYIDWPLEQVQHWLTQFHTQLDTQVSRQQLQRWFDLMGMQRHLKAIFIFARKFLRDHTPLYLSFIPRTLEYVLLVSRQYPEFCEFHDFLTKVVIPAYVIRSSDA